MHPPKRDDVEHKTKWMLFLLVPTGVLIYGSHSVLLNLSKVGGIVPFNSTSCVVMIETFKLIISLLVFWKGFTRDGGKANNMPSFQQSLLFSVPALLYCLNNNFVVHIQLYMDPASFQVLSNLKTVSTALLYWLIIRRRMTSQQWLAVFLLLLAGVANSYGGLHSKEDTSNMQIQVDSRGLALMSIYCCISGLAGVYTEYILKKHQEVSLSLQNVLLYTYGVAFNLVGFLWTSGFQPSSFFQGFSVWTVIIIVTQAFNGLIMSAIFKHGSNIIRLFIIASAMGVTTILSMLLFSLQLNLYFYCAFGLVIISLVLYHKR
ncbi:probable UDP-sugar transporter protein SLC35A4 [Antedon mediterranea]|uniref:probable UDP-sugar transporter protein SLC35A4 n=1 Tax=Antedon mediterranea TaxID=105859 RepID=UPI003AF948A2